MVFGPLGSSFSCFQNSGVSYNKRCPRLGNLKVRKFLMCPWIHEHIEVLMSGKSVRKNVEKRFGAELPAKKKFPAVF